MVSHLGRGNCSIVQMHFFFLFVLLRPSGLTGCTAVISVHGCNFRHVSGGSTCVGVRTMSGCTAVICVYMQSGCIAVICVYVLEKLSGYIWTHGFCKPASVFRPFFIRRVICASPLSSTFELLPLLSSESHNRRKAAGAIPNRDFSPVPARSRLSSSFLISTGRFIL